MPATESKKQVGVRGEELACAELQRPGNADPGAELALPARRVGNALRRRNGGAP
jgi:hypothetical protein